MDLTQIAGLGAQVGLIMEPLKQIALKSLKDRYGWSDDAYRVIIWALVAVLATIGGYAENITVAGWNPLAGAVAVGLAASLPSNVLHLGYEAAIGLHDWVVGIAPDTTSAPAPEPPPSVG